MKNIVNLFAILQAKKDGNPIRLIELTNNDLERLKDMLSKETCKLKQNAIKFSGEYKPEFDESLVIGNFELPDYVIEAINNPLAVDSLQIHESEIEKVKSIILTIRRNDSEFELYCQKFKKIQYLSPKFLKLFWDENTVHLSNKTGINITDTLDCYLCDKNLYFKSYYIANQIFNLNQYYREATNEDLEVFSSLENIKFEDNIVNFDGINTWARKKIAAILDSNVLNNIKATDLMQIAKELKVELKVEKKKIVIPIDNKSQKQILKFLSDEIFRGNLSNNIYETNSKKPSVS